MRVVHRDRKTGTIKVVPEVLDDLYHLANLIRPGDQARMSTYRTAEHTEDIERRGKVEKKRMTLTLDVESVEFHDFSDRLRVHGIITAGPQDHGLHHTFNIEPDGRTDIAIRKADGWRQHDLERLERAEKEAQQPLVYILAIEEDEATLATVHHYGVREVSSVATTGKGKMYKSAGKDEFFPEVAHRVITTRDPEAPLIIVGPGWTRERFLDHLKKHHAEHGKGLLTDGTGQAGMVGVREAIRRGVIQRVVQDHAVARDAELFEQLLQEIGRGQGLAAYGQDEVVAALNMGAVETLLVTDVAVREHKVEDALRLAEQTATDVHVLAEAHESGQQLQHFGGIAALLRFAVQGP